MVEGVQLGTLSLVGVSSHACCLRLIRFSTQASTAPQALRLETQKPQTFYKGPQMAIIVSTNREALNLIFASLASLYKL